MRLSATNSFFETDESFVLYVANTQDIRNIDNGFNLLLDEVKRNLNRPTIVETKASNFEKLIPEFLRNAMMWVILLPDEFSDDVETLADQLPFLWEYTSIDLQNKIPTFEWYGSTHRIIVNSRSLWKSTGEAYHERKPIIVVVATPSRAAFSRFTLDSEYADDFYTRRDAYQTYSAEDEYSADEIETAKMRSALMNGLPLVDGKGTRVIQLTSVRYMYDAD